MTKHSRDRNVKRGIIPRPSANEDPNALKSAGVQQAQAELQGYLTKDAVRIARAITIKRGYDWTSDQSGRALERAAYSDSKRLAAVLHRRGVVASQPCQDCLSRNDRPWQSCVVSPTVGGRVFQGGSCSNCLFRHRGYACSHRIDKGSNEASAACLSMQDTTIQPTPRWQDVSNTVAPNEVTSPLILRRNPDSTPLQWRTPSWKGAGTVTAAQPTLNPSESPPFLTASTATHTLTTHSAPGSHLASMKCNIPPPNVPPRHLSPVSKTSQTLTPKPVFATPMTYSPPPSNSHAETLPHPSSITASPQTFPANLTMHPATYTGQLLHLPLTGTAMNDPRQLFRARSDLARLIATVDGRLRELGYCNEDWRRSIYSVGEDPAEERA
ncbi:hypothetical protein ASPCAL10029 [Aspergillus calidoustus]|uniref:Uncharacterized protein n=1 Tax=Aspergillus calidoustus TaxID=454130 RepID=A0A0U5CBN7_ASPCI|nr:hypothetical protein ASPCAL10029 [Aspergillus calidoustus]